MTWLSKLGLAALFCIAVTLTLRVLDPNRGVVPAAPEVVSAPVALSVPVEIIRDGEDPTLRRIEIRP